MLKDEHIWGKEYYFSSIVEREMLPLTRGAGLALTARSWYSPDEHKQFHGTPTSDSHSVTLMDQDKTCSQSCLNTDKIRNIVQTTKVTKRLPLLSKVTD